MRIAVFTGSQDGPPSHRDAAAACATGLAKAGVGIVYGGGRVGLMGVVADYRDAATARLNDPAQLVRDQVAALEVQKTKVAESDALERTLAMTDSVAPNTKEYRSLKQLEGRTHRRMKWMIELMDLIPKFADAHPDILEARELLPLHPMNRRAAQQPVAPPPAEPEAEATLLPQPWVQSTPPIPTPPDRWTFLPI